MGDEEGVVLTPTKEVKKEEQKTTKHKTNYLIDSVEKLEGTLLLVLVIAAGFFVVLVFCVTTLLWCLLWVISQPLRIRKKWYEWWKTKIVDNTMEVTFFGNWDWLESDSHDYY